MKTETEEIKKTAAEEYDAEFDKKLEQSYDRIWKERDEFIQWVSLFAVGAMYFTINLLFDNGKSARPYLSIQMITILEASVLCFFVSLIATVVYKWRWPVKYLFHEMDLEFHKRKWEGGTEFETPGEFKRELEKFKKATKAYVRKTEFCYKAALAFFIIAFFPLFFALAALLHPQIAELL